MHFPARATLILSLLCAAAVVALAQSPQAVGTGTITGRITVGDKPAHGITVMLMPSNFGDPERKAAARATTDMDGQFRLMNIAAGQYQVAPVAPALVPADSTMGYRGQFKSVNLADGETVADIDFTLVRGGVVTGRVTDADGRPVIGENVRLAVAGQGNDRRGPFFFNPSLFQTDDRGIYRIYGIPPGSYVVSVGEGGSDGIIRAGMGRGNLYTRTFHPGVADQSKAAILEVTEGSETTNVDITLGGRAKTFKASGTVVDAETGKPVPNIPAAYGSLRAGETRMDSFGMGARTDAEGQFRFEGLLPGRYAAYVSDPQGETYNVPVTFEISEGDVAGLVVKVRRGASISGVAVVEGTSDRSVLAKLSQLRIAAYPETQTLRAPTFADANQVNADGSFRISGIAPGKVRLMPGGWPPQKGFMLLRVEREGVEQRAGIVEVPAGGQVTGVRLVFEYGSGIVRGQVQVKDGGTLLEGTYLYVTARRPGNLGMTLPGVEVDARGHFLIDGLPTGDYQLRLVGRIGQPGRPVPPVLQNVSVTNGVETEVTLVIDLNAKSEKDRP